MTVPQILAWTVPQILAWTVPPSLAVLGAAWAWAWSRSFEDDTTTVKKGS